MSASKIIIAVTVLLLAVPLAAQADENFDVWAASHERLMSKWRHQPRCGWTTGGYVCSRKHHRPVKYRFRCVGCAW
jgi:hypothetical protein